VEPSAPAGVFRIEQVFKETTMTLRATIAAAAVLAAAACTTTGNIERNAAGGAAIGALAGAVIGNNVGDGDAGDGAAVGAALGGAAGAVRGYGQDQRAAECARNGNQPLYRDARTGGYYFYPQPGASRTCWQNGAPRS
jgi:uncharacterized protein YcfJ